MKSLNPLTLGEDQCTLHDVSKFAHITGPRVGHEHFKRILAKRLNVGAMLLVELANEMLSQQRNVFLSIAHRRQVNRKYREPVIEVFAEPPLLNRLARLLIRGGQHPHVKFKFLFAAKSSDLSVFQNAQKLRLQRKRHLPDFIQEQRAAICQFEASRTSDDGSCECAFLMPEDFAFDQSFRYR